MAILSRVAERLYWGARYLERGEDSARIVKAHHDLMIDGGEALGLQWAHLGVIGGATEAAGHVPEPREWTSEFDIVHSLMSDPECPSSIVACVARSPREPPNHPRDHASGSLAGGERAFDVRRAGRSRSCRASATRCVPRPCDRRQPAPRRRRRVDHESLERLSNVASRAPRRTSRHDHRVLGVRAAGLLAARADAQAEGDSASGHVALGDDVEWMAVLRSLSALQMYHLAGTRSHRGRSRCAVPPLPRTLSAIGGRVLRRDSIGLDGPPVLAVTAESARRGSRRAHRM